jgi:hypothetical protein
MGDDPKSQTQFLEHFVPQGPSDLGLDVKGFTSASAFATLDSHGDHPLDSHQGAGSEGKASSTSLEATSASTATDQTAMFYNICKIGTTTVEGVVTVAATAAQTARVAKKKKERLQAAQASADPSHHAPGDSIQTSEDPSYHAPGDSIQTSAEPSHHAPGDFMHAWMAWMTCCY